MIPTIKRWLETGRIDIFLGYRLLEGHPLPFAFGHDDLAELDGLIIGEVRYPLEKIAMQLAAEQPEIKIGMIARDCSQRALNVLYIWNQLSPENIRTFNVNCCPSDLKKKADCSYLKPEKSGSFKKQVGIDNIRNVSEVSRLSTVPVHRYLLPLQNGPDEPVEGLIGPLPRAIDGKIPQ